MKSLTVSVLVLVAFLGSCANWGPEDLSALAAKPALPFSVMVAGGAFVAEIPDPATAVADGDVRQTFATESASGGSNLAFPASQLRRFLEQAKVFVALGQDSDPGGAAATLAKLDEGAAGRSAALLSTMTRARRDGHDFVLVLEQILDGPIENRGVNDRWPFTIGAWLFALGAFIPDRTFESQARLRLSLRDVYSGRRVFGPILVEAGPVDVNMFARCGIWGFVQSLVVPPFWTSSSPERLTASVRELTVDRLLVAAVRRLKSADVLDRLRRSGPATIDIDPSTKECALAVVSQEPVGAVVVRFDGREWGGPEAARFAAQFLASQERDGSTYRYFGSVALPNSVATIQVLVETTAARISSSTQSLGSR